MRHSTIVRSIVVAACVCFVVAACATGKRALRYNGLSDGDWATVRGGPGNPGRSAASASPALNTILWTVKTGGLTGSEPLVRGGLVFHGGLDRRVEVYDARTGDRRYRARFDGPIVGLLPLDSTLIVVTDHPDNRAHLIRLRDGREQSSFRVPNPSAPPRMASDSSFILPTWDGHLVCLSVHGHTIWEATCEGPVLHAPAVADTVVYAASGRSIFAVGLSDGRVFWQHGVAGMIRGGPAVDGHIYFGTADSFVCMLDPANGESTWSRHVGGGITSSPALSDSLVYVTANDGFVYSLSRTTGEIRWKFDTGALANLSPTLVGDQLIVAARQPAVFLLNALTGEKISETALKKAADSPPVFGEGFVLVQDFDRHLYCLGPPPSK